MVDDNEMDSVMKYAFRFGEIAVKKGFITTQQLEEALDEQVILDLSNDQHKLIGEILLEKRYLTSEQIAAVLEELVRKKPRSKAS